MRFDYRIIYVLMFVAVAIPILLGYQVEPARLQSAERMFAVIENLEPKEGEIALLAFDFGPNTKGENLPQAEIVLEHLMRKRVPVLLFSLYHLSFGFLQSSPEKIAKRLMEENPGETWEYGKDWINVGYRPGSSLFLQSFAKAEKIPAFLAQDVLGTPLDDMPMLRETDGIEDVIFLGEFTGLVGILDSYLQFFQKRGYVPPLGHGCTSITIPEAFIYLDSGQIDGLLEGIAGAAWYSELVKKRYESLGEDSALVINTALGVAHLVIIFLIILGNVADLIERRRAA